MGHPNVNANLTANGQEITNDNPLPVAAVGAGGEPVSPSNPQPVQDAGANFGTVTTSDTTAVVGNFSCVYVLNDAVFETFSEEGGTGALTGITLPAGLPIYGKITGYKLTSGVIRAYKSA